jgi:hypothetical protein
MALYYRNTGNEELLMAGSCVIQWQLNLEFCLGIAGEPAENIPVVLADINSPYTTWLLDSTTNLIALAANPTLVLSIEGGSTISDGLGLCLLPLQEVPLNQQWSWLSDPPYIVWLPDPQFCVDNTGSVSAVGNRIQINSVQPDGASQGWNLFVPV